MTMVVDAPENSVGLKKIGYWDTDTGGPTLVDVLTEKGIDFQKTEIPNIMGTAGYAYAIDHKSQSGPGRVTVLCIPHSAIDSAAETYFYFFGEGKPDTSAFGDADWAELYDACHKADLEYTRLLRSLIPKAPYVPPANGR